MYRLVLYSLFVLVVISFVFGFFQILPFSPLQFLATLGILLASCYLSNTLFAKLFHATTNNESFIITAFILFFILAPSLDITDLVIVFVVGVGAMASKYLLALNKKHIFNPIAISIFVMSLFGFGNAIWWAGSAVLLPFVAIGGFLIVRKLRKMEMVLVFFSVAVLTICFFNLQQKMTIQDSFVQSFTSWPLVFFGTIMLTEPLTLPPQKRLQLIYGVLVGLFFGLQFKIGPLFASPELALVFGNIFAYSVSSKQKLFISLVQQLQIGQNMYEFVFTKTQGFNFSPGQYLEWTLPIAQPDARGNRRYFTIASSPTEENIKLGVKIIPDASSAFKKQLSALAKGSSIIGAQLAGDFVLPKDKMRKLVFIAGGIGITPFRSMVKYLIDNQEQRDIVLFYSASHAREFVYKDIFTEGEAVGIKTIYVITISENAPAGWNGVVGHITPQVVEANVFDFKTRNYYLSGPNVMVEGYKKLLRQMGVKKGQIVTDYFPGF